MNHVVVIAFQLQPRDQWSPNHLPATHQCSQEWTCMPIGV